MIRVVLFLDLRVACNALAVQLAECEDIDVVGTAVDIEGVLTVLGETDVLLAPPMIADRETLAQLQRPGRGKVKLKLLMLGATPGMGDIAFLSQLGICGFIAKDASLAETTGVIRAVMQGELVCLSPSLLKPIGSTTVPRRSQGRESISCTYQRTKPELTPTEAHVFKMLGHGLSNKEIARDLHVAISTAKHHVHNLLTKLELDSRQKAGILYHLEGPEACGSPTPAATSDLDPENVNNKAETDTEPVDPLSAGRLLDRL